MLALPKTSGWMVMWYTVAPSRRSGERKIGHSFESRSKAEVEAKAEELKKAGLEVRGIYECIF